MVNIVHSMRDQQAKNKRTFIVVSIVVGWLIFGGFVGYLIGSGISYHFASIMKQINGFKGFSDLAVGDSVFKAPFSDTIYLFKTETGKKYHFTFMKP